MTRDTKIGLLVGLAFIILIGILLSDHLTSSTEPPPAALAPTGNNVRQTIATPGGTQMPVTAVTAPQVQPQRQILTSGDLDNQSPATAIVRVGGPAAPQQQQQTRPVPQPQQQAQPTAPVQQEVAEAPTPPVQAHQPTEVAGADVPNSSELARIARQNGEPVVTMTPGGGQPQQAMARMAPNHDGITEYTAQPGDSLSRIASKAMGSASKANIAAIIAANPSIADPNVVIAGHVYKIPAASTATPSSSAIQTAPVVQSQAPAASASEYWYTIKPGDNLTKIAREQLGQDGTAIPAIVELNRDVLKDPNNIVVNSRIRLPGKPVAQVN